jgi:hypothetical protein
VYNVPTPVRLTRHIVDRNVTLNTGGLNVR